MKPIVVVGSINADLVATVDHIPTPGETISGADFQIHSGGKGANQAVAAARLGHPVKMIGRLGNDIYGKRLRADLENAGVDSSLISLTEGSSGTALILVSKSGENSIVVIPGVNASVSPDDIQASLTTIQQAGIVLTQLEIPIETVLCLAEICHREGIPLMLDPAPAVSLPRELLRNITWFTPNETEAAFYIRAFSAGPAESGPTRTAQALANAGIDGVILKLGSNGSFISRDGFEQHVPSFPVAAIDSTAAGDTFNGAFATALMRNLPWAESARFATAAAAISVTRVGAQPSMPTLAEVNALVEETGAGQTRA